MLYHKDLKNFAIWLEVCCMLSAWWKYKMNHSLRHIWMCRNKLLWALFLWEGHPQISHVVCILLQATFGRKTAILEPASQSKAVTRHSSTKTNNIAMFLCSSFVWQPKIAHCVAVQDQDPLCCKILSSKWHRLTIKNHLQRRLNFGSSLD